MTMNEQQMMEEVSFALAMAGEKLIRFNAFPVLLIGLTLDPPKTAIIVETTPGFKKALVLSLLRELSKTVEEDWVDAEIPEE